MKTAVCPVDKALLATGTRLSDTCVLQHAILENADHAIIATDLSGTVLYFNRTAQRLLGYSWDEVVGRSTPALTMTQLKSPAEPKRTGPILARMGNAFPYALPSPRYQTHEVVCSAILE